MRLDRAQADSLLRRLRDRKVAVLGDLMLDEYLFGEVHRISPEAPVPIVRIVGERSVLGGAANVAANLRALGAEPILVGTLNNDLAGERLQALLAEKRISGDGVMLDPSRPTITKTRVVGQQQQMLRIDREQHGHPEGEALQGLLEAVTWAVSASDVLLVSDYAKGVVCAQVMDRVRECHRSSAKPWIVDPKPGHRALYQGATILTPNASETTELTGLPARTDAEVAAAGRALMDRLGLKGLLVTRSDKGMALFAPDGDHREPWLIPTEAREVFDVSGAGDTVIAAFAASIAAGADWREAAMLSNAAAGVVVGKRGTATATPEEILAHYRDQEAL